MRTLRFATMLDIAQDVELGSTTKCFELTHLVCTRHNWMPVSRTNSWHLLRLLPNGWRWNSRFDAEQFVPDEHHHRALFRASPCLHRHMSIVQADEKQQQPEGDKERDSKVQGGKKRQSKGQNIIEYSKTTALSYFSDECTWNSVIDTS